MMETLQYAKEVKAKKDHRCNFCSQKIAKGEVYSGSVHKMDGSIYSWRTHLLCNYIADRLKMYEDCDEGLSEEGFEETIHSVYFDLMLSKFDKEDIKKYSEVVQQLRSVYFRSKLQYVIHHYKKLDASL